MDASGVSYTLYVPGKSQHSICPSFYECLTTQSQHIIDPTEFPDDAAAGNIPNVSIVIPRDKDSEHNGKSLMRGENWIARNVSALMSGPAWDSTAIFVTYDDCGCFYDPVPPPAGMGIREPMVIVSPWAKPHFVDHEVASHASMLSFIEHVFAMPNLGMADAGAYDYMGSFDFGQPPRPGIPLPQHRVPASSIRYIATHPTDPNDPT
jgi:phospholipase C